MCVSSNLGELDCGVFLLLGSVCALLCASSNLGELDCGVFLLLGSVCTSMCVFKFKRVRL